MIAHVISLALFNPTKSRIASKLQIGPRFFGQRSIAMVDDVKNLVQLKLEFYLGSIHAKCSKSILNATFCIISASDMRNGSNLGGVSDRTSLGGCQGVFQVNFFGGVSGGVHVNFSGLVLRGVSG